MKFFRALNGLLGKIGTKNSPSVAISLVNSFANPVLIYGLETGILSSQQVEKLKYPYNSIYMKLFDTFDNNTISHCQFYFQQLPLEHLLNLRFLTFCHNIVTCCCHSPACTLFYLCGSSEFKAVADSYGIDTNDSLLSYKRNVWQKFKNELDNKTN